MTDAFRPIPPERQPSWLRQLHLVIEVYPPDAATGFGAALCRWCDLTWPVPMVLLEADPDARAAWVLRVAEHGLQDAVDGDVQLDERGLPRSPGEEAGWR